MPPVQLFLEDTGMYHIGDGIHRTNAARVLRYDTVPALTTEPRNTPPPADKGTEALRLHDIGWDLLKRLRAAAAGGLDFIDVDSTTATGFEAHVITFDVRQGVHTDGSRNFP
jgi:hypothetical protein